MKSGHKLSWDSTWSPSTRLKSPRSSASPNCWLLHGRAVDRYPTARARAGRRRGMDRRGAVRIGLPGGPLTVSWMIKAWTRARTRSAGTCLGATTSRCPRPASTAISPPPGWSSRSRRTTEVVLHPIRRRATERVLAGRLHPPPGEIRPCTQPGAAPHVPWSSHCTRTVKARVWWRLGYLAPADAGARVDWYSPFSRCWRAGAGCSSGP